VCLPAAFRTVLMPKSLQLVLMAAAAIATSLFSTVPSVRAETSPGESSAITSTTDDSGHKIYTNDEVSTPLPAKRRSPSVSSRSLEYWSTTEHRWKPVPGANIRAARSAADEVNQYLDKRGNPATDLLPTQKMFTQADVDAAVDEAAKRHNVDPNLVRAVIKVESNFNPNAVSRKGAMGLMQLMPQTARQLNVTNPFDPEQNVDAGVRHLKKLMESYGGDVKLSLAAYNAGAGAVARSAGIPNFTETRNYVKRITQIYYGGSDPGSGFFSPAREPIRVQRDARGVLYFSNTD